MFQIAMIAGIIAIAFSILRIFGASMTMNEGKKLKSKFVSLGNFAGKDLTQIKSVCGVPKEFQDLGNGNKIITWSEKGYSITILFNKDNLVMKKIKESLV